MLFLDPGSPWTVFSGVGLVVDVRRGPWLVTDLYSALFFFPFIPREVRGDFGDEGALFFD